MGVGLIKYFAEVIKLKGYYYAISLYVIVC